MAEIDLEVGQSPSSQVGGVIFKFTEDTFKEAMDTYGPENLAQTLSIRAGNSVPSELSFTLDSLRTGDAKIAPILDMFPVTKDMSLEERKEYFSNPEAALALFSNMEDFGMYEANVTSYPGLEAIADSFARMIPSGILASEGLKKGAQVTSRALKNIRPRSPAGLIAKAGGYGFGALTGAGIGYEVGQEISDYAFGDPLPIAPSLMAYNNFGETAALSLNPSALSLSFRATKDPNWLGANDFLKNYRQVTKGRWPGLNNAEKITEAASGLDPKIFQQALNSSQGRPFAFGKLGFDPSLGPKSSRFLGAVETGIGGMRDRANKRRSTTLIFDALAGTGASVGAFTAESFFPGSELARFGSEILFAGLPGPIIEGGVKGSVAASDRLKDLFLRMVNDDGVGDVKRRIGMQRILKAVTSNPDYTGDDMINVFLQQIENADFGDEKIPVSLFSASKNNKITKILQQIDMNLGTVSDELEVATEKGREQFIANAKAAIMELKAQGDPEAVQLAATLQKDLFSESLQNEMTSKLKVFYDALDAVTGGNPEAIQKYNVSDMLFTRLNKFMDDVKDRENTLWGDVGNYTLNNFDEDNLPSMMGIFDVPYQDGGLRFNSETAKAQFWSNLPKGTADDLKLVFNYFGRNLDGTPIGQETGGTSTSQISPALSKAYDSFQEKADELQGTQLFDVLRRTEERADGISDVNERIRYLRTQADNLREETSNVSRSGLGDGTGNRSRALATAFDRLAQIELLKSREVNTTRLSAGTVDGEELENPLNAERLYDMRSALLAASSSLRKNRDPRSGGRKTAKSMDRMAEAVLTDLLSDDTASESYNLARAFTQASRDVTERSFLGDFKDVDKKGRPIVTTENALEYIFKRGGSDQAIRRMQEMDDARQFISNEMGLDAEAASKQVGDIDASMQSVLQWAFSNTVDEVADPNDPTKTLRVINPTKLKAFRAKPENQELLARFPTIARELGNSESAQYMYNTLKDDAALFNTSDNVKALEAVIATGEKPGLIAANAINSAQPFQELKNIIHLVKNKQNVSISPDGSIDLKVTPRGTIENADGVEYTQEQALNGLRSAILTYATTKSGNEGLKFNARTMFDTLFTKLPNMDSKDASLAKFMEQENLMSPEQIANMKTALKQMINIDEAFQKGNLEEVLFKNPTKAKLLAARSMGAMMGARGLNQFNELLQKMGLGGGGNSMGAGLVIARGGAESAQDFFLVAPEAAINKGMIEIMQDPKLFRELTLEIQNKKQYQASNRAINQFFANLGVDQLAKRQSLITRPILMASPDYEPYEEPETEVEEVVTPTDFSQMSGAEIRAMINSGEIKSREDQKRAQEALRRRRLPSNDQQGAVAPPPRPPVPTPSPVGPPTTRASAVPSPAPAPVNSGPVDRTRYAALFPNDPIVSMMQPRQMRRGGIASLLE